MDRLEAVNGGSMGRLAVPNFEESFAPAAAVR